MVRKALVAFGWFFAGMLLVGALAFVFLAKPQVTGLTVFGSNTQPIVAEQPTTLPTTNALENFAWGESDVIRPEDFPVREEFFREIFRPRRESYKLFEKASAFLGKDIEGVKKFFLMDNEMQIWEKLPKAADDFSEIAYLFASGNYFTIGLLGPEYYKQPELYANFKTGGLKYWAKPDPRYWVPHGFGSYPSEQWDTLSLSGRKEFTGVVFVHSGWGVQTYQGMTLLPDSEFVKYFDVEITPQNFLLEPVWPRFGENWAYKVTITGRLKPETKPGSYKLAINVFTPPKELKEQWGLEHRNLYFDGSVSPVGPQGNFIEFNITVTE